MLHDPEMAHRAPEHAGYADINDWWRGQGTCINGSWRKFQKALEQASEKTEKEKKEEEEKGEDGRKKEKDLQSEPDEDDEEQQQGDEDEEEDDDEAQLP